MGQDRAKLKEVGRIGVHLTGSHQSKSSRCILRTDGDFDCPGADVLLYPSGVGLSMKVASCSL
jgi:hypothetical protein